MQTETTVFYGIDIGTASNCGGFYCWRWQPNLDGGNKFRQYNNFEWQDCVKQVARDYRNGYKLVLGIEAALWGFRNSAGLWSRRFTCKEDPSYGETPWYMQAGAATGFVAQQFLAEVANKCRDAQSAHRIRIYETYISGLKYYAGSKATNQLRKRKPKSNHSHLKSGSKHSYDALESLYLCVEKHDKTKAASLSKDLYSEDITSALPTWNRENPGIKFSQGGDPFPIGILSNKESIFDFKAGDILFTVRKYGPPVSNIIKKSA